MGHINELYDFTTSAFVLHPSEPKFLLLKHRKIGKWLQPGGHVELDENPLQALQHELEEEAGLRPSDYEFIDQPDHPRPVGNNIILPLPFYFNEHPFNESHRHIDICYLIKAKTEAVTDNPDGADAIAWLSLNDIHSLHESSEMFDDTLAICQWVGHKYF